MRTANLAGLTLTCLLVLGTGCKGSDDGDKDDGLDLTDAEAATAGDAQVRPDPPMAGSGGGSAGGSAGGDAGPAGEQLDGGPGVDAGLGNDAGGNGPAGDGGGPGADGSLPGTLGGPDGSTFP